MRLRHRVVAYAMTSILKLIMKTCRMKVSGLDLFLGTAQEGSTIVSLWHGAMAIIPPLFEAHKEKTTFVACISKSRDGEWLDAVVKLFPPALSIRIGHQARAYGLLEMIREIEKGKRSLLVTPDGPKGPRKVMKEGILEISKKTGAPIFSIDWKSSGTFHLPTWDRFRIPRPFSTVEVVISKTDPTADAVTSGMNSLSRKDR